MRRFLWLFVVTNLCLSVYFLDFLPSANPVARAVPVLTIVDEGTMAIDRYGPHMVDKAKVGEHMYSDKAPLSTFIVVPVYAIVGAFQGGGAPTLRARLHRAQLIGDLLCGSLPFVLLALAAFRALPPNSTGVSPVLLSVLPLYGSFLFAYTGTFFGHLLAGLFLLPAYLLVKRQERHFLAGFCVGLAFLTEFPTALALPIWAAQTLFLTRDIRKTALLLLGFAPAALIILIHNWSITGSPWDMVYNHVANEEFAGMRDALGFSYPSPIALVTMLFGPARGLFFYSPIFFLLSYLLVRDLRRSQVALRTWVMRNYLAPLTIAYVLLISSYFMWWGGWCYGPRHLIPVVMLLLYEGIQLLGRTPFSPPIFYALCGIGFVLNWLSKATTAYNIPEKYVHPVWQVFLPSLVAGQFNEGVLPKMLFGLRPGTSSFLWLPVFALGIGFLTWQWKKGRVGAPRLDTAQGG